MTDDRLPLAELMAKTGDGDFLRTVDESVLQIIMEADVDGLIGAGRHERAGDSSTWRNGYRDQEAWIAGVSTRRVDELVQAMGMNGISSRRCRSSARTSTSA